MQSEDFNKVFERADCLYSDEQVRDAINSMAEKITQDLATRNPVVLCVMTGAMIPAGHLMTLLNFPLQIDYIHATRYRGNTSGGSLHWIVRPSVELKGRVVLIIDDIYDEGITLSEIQEYCWSEGAEDVRSAVLVNKLHDRKHPVNIDYIGLETEDRYLFGYGMDYHGYWRNAPGIYAIGEQE